MDTRQWKDLIEVYDDRRDIIVPGDVSQTLEFCVDQFVSLAEESIKARGAFFVALSGGSTPKSLYQLLASPKYKNKVDWSKVHLFWSDERCVPPDHPDSNYHMAMSAGFSTLPLNKDNIHRMPADAEDLEAAATAYEALIERVVHGAEFDLTMLGMGDDGHTASLFPKTHGLHSMKRLVVANFVPSKEIWRMTFTFNLINSSKAIDIYVVGKSKAAMLKNVLTSPYSPDDLPIQKVGTRRHKALFIVDSEAAAGLRPNF